MVPPPPLFFFFLYLTFNRQIPVTFYCFQRHGIQRSKRTLSSIIKCSVTFTPSTVIKALQPFPSAQGSSTVSATRSAKFTVTITILPLFLQHYVKLLPSLEFLPAPLLPTPWLGRDLRLQSEEPPLVPCPLKWRGKLEGEGREWCWQRITTSQTWRCRWMRPNWQRREFFFMIKLSRWFRYVSLSTGMLTAPQSHKDHKDAWKSLDEASMAWVKAMIRDPNVGPSAFYEEEECFSEIIQAYLL